MGAIISFDSIKDFWGHRNAFFEVLLHHSVIRHSSPEKLPTVYGDVEREISFYLNLLDPETYPEVVGGMYILNFDDYSRPEQEEFLSALKKGVEEIRRTSRKGVFTWNFESKTAFAERGEELIELMERSLAADDDPVAGSDEAKAQEPQA